MVHVLFIREGNKRVLFIKKKYKIGILIHDNFISYSQMSREDQSIPIIVSRNREVPLLFISPDRKLTWDDVPGDGDSAMTNMDMDVILFRDCDNIICLLKGSGTKFRRYSSENKSLTKEWIHNYSILYITIESSAKDVREKSIYSLGRIKDEGTNMKRYANNSDSHDVAIGTRFPFGLNHTVKGTDSACLFLFELKYGKKRSLTPIKK